MIVTALFKNTSILKFKTQLHLRSSLPSINHLSRPLRKQKFTSKGSKGVICDWWILIRFVCLLFVACDRNYD